MAKLMTKRIAVFHTDATYADKNVAAFAKALPDYEVGLWQPGQPADYLIAWKPNKALVDTPQLQKIFALGAGVDAFLAAGLPPHIELVRLEEAGMGAQMLELALYAILYHTRQLGRLRQAQHNREWLGSAAPMCVPFSARVGVMGLGQLGAYVATQLATLGYAVSGYSKHVKQMAGVRCFGQAQLTDFLAQCEILINLLPLTTETENLMNKQFFSHLPKGAFLVNLARGGHLVEQDLQPTLDSGQLSGALLDVFQVEPLPKDHPFWCDERIIITPHVAAITFTEEAVRQISRNIRAIEENKPLTGVVNRDRGY